MKKSLFISSLIALLAMSTFTGCENTSSSSSNQITSSNLTEQDKFENMLKNLRKGVQFVGTLNQEVKYLDSFGGAPTGKVTENQFDVELSYESNEENGYSALAHYFDVNQDEEVYLLDTTVFEGEDGYAYYYALNYDNTIVRYPMLDRTGYEHANFAYYYANPFSYFLAEDFIKVENKENTYTLNNGKAAFFASNVLGDLDPAFFGVIKNIEFVIENYELKTINVVPDIAYDSQTDYETWNTIFFSIEQVATFEVKKAGTNKVSKPAPRETKEEHAALKSALDKFSSKNFTANLELEYTKDGETNGGATITYYFDGKNMLFSTLNEGEKVPTDVLLYQYAGNEYLTPLGRDLDKDEFTKEAAGNLASMDGVLTYNDVTPKVSEVKAEIFNYDKLRKNYRVCDELVSTIGSVACVPLLNPAISSLNGSCTSFVIKLTADENIDYITFTTQTISTYNVITKGKLTFENIGTTVLPEYVYVEE